MIEASDVAEHYSREDLVSRLRSALTEAGLDGISITAKDLAPLDQFHSRGIAATVELGRLMNPSAETKVLDLGSGLGGPSRYLAATYRCHVSGIDLSPSYVDAANYLAERAGLSDLVDYSCANALALPFGDATFDVVWTQHVAMNIADRAGFYAEAHRVLKPGGKLAIYDVIAGDGGPILFPVPWSRGPETSFLMSAPQMQAKLKETGFILESWTDCTEAAIAWFTDLRKQQEANGNAAPALGLHLAVGPDFKTMSRNLAQNLSEGRAAIAQAIYVRD